MILLNFGMQPELEILMILLKQSSVQKKICIDLERQFNASYIKMSKSAVLCFRDKGISTNFWIMFGSHVIRQNT